MTSPLPKSEARLAAILSDMPSTQVKRAGNALVKTWGMRENQCHDNCELFSTGMPFRSIIGWWDVPGLFLLHSVIDTGSMMLCVTPFHFEDPDNIIFIPDERIKFREAKGRRERGFYRSGTLIPTVVRKNDPDQLSQLPAWLQSQLCVARSLSVSGSTNRPI